MVYGKRIWEYSLRGWIVTFGRLSKMFHLLPYIKLMVLWWIKAMKMIGPKRKKERCNTVWRLKQSSFLLSVLMSFCVFIIAKLQNKCGIPSKLPMKVLMRWKVQGWTDWSMGISSSKWNLKRKFMTCKSDSLIWWVTWELLGKLFKIRTLLKMFLYA